MEKQAPAQADDTRADVMLGFNVARFVHVYHGWAFGPMVRRVFLGSTETSRVLDCLFETGEDANLFLTSLMIEHTIAFVSHGSHGLHEYLVTRPFFDGTGCEVHLRIHAMESGLMRGSRVPRNIPEPAFDIDHFFWRRDGIRECMPHFCRRIDYGFAQASWLAYAVERLQARRFCVVNSLCNRSPKAMLTVLDSCLHMVANEGFTQDNPYKPIIETPTVFLHTATGGDESRRVFCPIKQEGLANNEPAVRLPGCDHVFSFAGIKGWVEQKGLRGDPVNPDGTVGRSVACPLCSRVFVGKELSPSFDVASTTDEPLPTVGSL